MSNSGRIVPSWRPRLSKRVPFGVAVICALVLGVLASCGSQSTGQGTETIAEPGVSETTSTTPTSAPITVNVAAVSSWAGVGEDLATAFAEDGHPSVRINLSYDPSTMASSDVIISAIAAQTGHKTDAEDAENPAPVVIASDRLVLATAPGNLGSIVRLDQLHTNPKLRIATCAEATACGIVTSRYLKDSSTVLTSPTQAATTADVAAAINAGDVDAGFLFFSDATTLRDDLEEHEGRIIVLDLPGAEPVLYRASVPATSPHSHDRRVGEAAGQFREWLQTDTAHKILRGHGFNVG